MKLSHIQKICRTLIVVVVLFTLLIIVNIFCFHENSGKTVEYFYPINNNLVNNYELELITHDMQGLSVEKLFIYLVQTEHCIPEHFITKNEFFANSIACQCDVIIFSFKEKCLSSKPSHVEYLDPRANTWNTGRNILYKAALARDTNYLYYVFVDDDIKLFYNDKYTPVQMKSIPPMRAFEQFLIDHEPAVGVPNYKPHHNSEDTIQSYREVCLPHIKPNETLYANRTYFGPKMPLHLTVVHFDAILNAFHRDAILDLLPYTTEYDFQDWTFSQRLVIVKVELLFRGHAVMFTPVIAENPLHRNYPRDTTGEVGAWKKFITDTAQEIPFEYSDDTYIQQFLDDPIVYQEHSFTYCNKFPPKYPIKKYSHFKLKWSL